jgi:hypothetical protein
MHQLISAHTLLSLLSLMHQLISAHTLLSLLSLRRVVCLQDARQTDTDGVCDLWQ